MKLDLIEGIEIHEDFPVIQNFHSIPQLLKGIFMCYNMIRDLQVNYIDMAYPGATQSQKDIHKLFTAQMAINNEPALQGVNLMHWYSINLINYAKCCGLVKFLILKKIQPEMLAGNKELIGELKALQKEYLEGIPELEPVLHFRNKAAAHLAYTDPLRNDNPSTMIESMSLIPWMINDRLSIGVTQWSRGEHMSSFGSHQWNVQDNFESLIPRYFRHYIPKGYEWKYLHASTLK